MALRNPRTKAERKPLMSSENLKEAHDLSAAVVKIQTFIELVEDGYDFSVKNGPLIIETAKQAVARLESLVSTSQRN